MNSAYEAANVLRDLATNYPLSGEMRKAFVISPSVLLDSRTRLRTCRQLVATEVQAVISPSPHCPPPARRGPFLMGLAAPTPQFFQRRELRLRVAYLLVATVGHSYSHAMRKLRASAALHPRAGTSPARG